MPPSSMQLPMQTSEKSGSALFCFYPHPPSLTFCRYYGHGLDHLSFGWWLLTFSWAWSLWARFLNIAAGLILVYDGDITMFRSCWKSSIASCLFLKTDPNSLMWTWGPGPVPPLWPYVPCLKLCTLSFDTPVSLSDQLDFLPPATSAHTFPPEILSSPPPTPLSHPVTFPVYILA